MRKVGIVENGMTFPSVVAAANWLIDNKYTKTKQRTIAGNLRKAISEQTEAYGFHWYSYTDMKRDVNMKNRFYMQSPSTKVKTGNRQIIRYEKLRRKWAEEERDRRNQIIKKLRTQNFEDAEGIRSKLYRNITPYVRTEDILQECAMEFPTPDFAVLLEDNWFVCEDIAWFVAKTRICLDRELITQMIEEGRCGDLRVMISEDYKNTLRALLEKFE